ncbi:hypothetical protein GIB67_014661 [Kingdonia uniflora]|uniref:Uncharacterized protein n=1 Tax=Kingdonia uniflora TaxID=39325 RepID=A0A7J7LY58_9MAGN|nr:hypothetical protein GIB67_014661 [Kingdonia uniflora]
MTSIAGSYGWFYIFGLDFKHKRYLKDHIRAFSAAHSSTTAGLYYKEDDDEDEDNEKQGNEGHGFVYYTTTKLELGSLQQAIFFQASATAPCCIAYVGK